MTVSLSPNGATVNSQGWNPWTMGVKGTAAPLGLTETFPRYI